jgi:opacity protein-like surface antigen
MSPPRCTTSADLSLATALFSGLLFATTAVAEDWSGDYVGAFGPYETATRKISVPDTYAEAGSDHVNGWGMGALAGYNWQTGSFQLGAETDATWSEVEPRMTYPFRSSSQAIHIYDDFNYLGSLRGRAGYAFGPFLLYGTGGIAWMHGASRLNMAEGAIPNWGPSVANDHASAFHLGLVGGAGLEWKLDSALTLRTEWLYYDFAPEPYDYSGVSLHTQGGGGVNAFRAAVITKF